MGRPNLLALANRGFLRHAASEAASSHQPDSTDKETGRALLSNLPKELQQFNPSLRELSDLLGEEWAAVAADPWLLSQWIHTIRVNRMVEAGVIPPSFTEKAYWANCGDVLIDFACNTDLQACPWCFCSRDKLPRFEC
jgi:hypothetical protein